ncbi:MAG: hypothetical protein RLZZ367_386, partial [Bacteroidota bacterium]
LKQKAGNNIIRYTVPKDFFNSGTLVLTVIISKDMKEHVVRYRNIKTITINRLEHPVNNLMGLQRKGLLNAEFEWKCN